MQQINIVRQWSRRDFIKAGGLVALGVALGGCAKNPVTGRSQFMVLSEEDEIKIDKQAAPQQLSNDYGKVQDKQLNQYVSGVGTSLAKTSHRPDMPYSFRVVGANYVNAYAFPGGTIACTRGIMLELDNEAELSALLGHEIGHVNARHTSSRMSSQIVVGTLAGVGGAFVGAKYGGGWGALAGTIGGFGAGLLLASYSRDDERQADALGLEYMTNAQYNPDGMIGLMDMLNEQHTSKPSALEVMFATHPMSSERLATARKEAKEKYMGASEYKVYRERFMDNTATLRAKGPAIRELQEAEKLIGQASYDKAEERCKSALKKEPKDYTGLLLMSKTLIAQEKYDEAQKYARKANAINPAEPQAMQFGALLALQNKKYGLALQNFNAYDKAMPGNAYITFYKGYSKEQMGKKKAAARDYIAFLKLVNQGDQAKYAYARLVKWGYIKGEAAPAPDPLRLA